MMHCGEQHGAIAAAARSERSSRWGPEVNLNGQRSLLKGRAHLAGFVAEHGPSDRVWISGRSLESMTLIAADRSVVKYSTGRAASKPDLACCGRFRRQCTSIWHALFRWRPKHGAEDGAITKCVQLHMVPTLVCFLRRLTRGLYRRCCVRPSGSEGPALCYR
jgi:hypothetical protein